MMGTVSRRRLLLARALASEHEHGEPKRRTYSGGAAHRRRSADFAFATGAREIRSRDAGE